MESRQVEEQALAWLARRDSGSWSAADQAEFDLWIGSATTHRVAYLRLEAGWERAAKLKVLGAGSERGAVRPPQAWYARAFSGRLVKPHVSAIRRVPRAWLAAAAIGFPLFIGAATYLTSYFRADLYRTPTGAVASISLQDGSSMTLNSHSRARVALTAKERHIALEEGEAYFDVAKDPTRPFVVAVADQRVIAVGTAFSVRREAGAVKVVVTSGKVRVEPDTGGAGAELSAGEVLRAGAGTSELQRKTPRQAEDALSWRSGYLIFDETTLADAVAEFNRYTMKRIVIDDAGLGALRINGKFRSTHSDDFVDLLRNGFGIETEETEDATHLRRH